MNKWYGEGSIDGLTVNTNTVSTGVAGRVVEKTTTTTEYDQDGRVVKETVVKEVFSDYYQPNWYIHNSTI